MKMVNLMMRGTFSFFFFDFYSVGFLLCFVIIIFICWSNPYYDENGESDVRYYWHIFRILPMS
jgi:hypothetical protein